MARNVDRLEGDRNHGGILAGAWINVVIGLAIAAVPFFTDSGDEAFWNNIVVGLIVAVLALYNAWAANNATGTVAWVAGINLLLGIWIVVSPFIFAVDAVHFWSDVILGLVLALIAAFNAWSAATAGTRTYGRPGV